MNYHTFWFHFRNKWHILITLGKFLESRAKNKTSDAITKLMNLAPKTALRLENDKLRERLGEVEKTASAKSQHHGRENLQRIYNDGFHICTYSYGQRRENDEECMFCDELLFRE